MKYLYLLIILLLPFDTFSQSALFWSAEQNVSIDNSSLLRPRIAISNDIPVIVWASAADYNIYFSKWTGNSFTTPVAINTHQNTYAANWTGPEIAASGDTIYIVFTSSPINASKIYLLRSFDGGDSFSDTIRVDAPAFGEIAQFPSVAIKPGGHPAVNYMLVSLTGEEYAVAQSYDGGNTFQAPVIASQAAPGSVCDCCPAQLITEGNIQILAYRNNDNNKRNIWGSLSLDNGGTFPVAEDIDSTNWMINACPSTGPDIHINGDSLYTVWMSAADGKKKIYFSSASRLNLEMTKRKKLYDYSTSIAFQHYPRIAGAEDTIGVVWEDYRNGRTRILFSHSTNGMTDIGLQIDTASVNQQGHQVTPDIAYLEGEFHVTYQDVSSGHIIYRKASFHPLGVKSNIDKGIEINIAPNPAKERLNIYIPGSKNEKTVELYSINGTAILSHHFTDEETAIAIKDLPSGVYFLKIKIDSHFHIEKVLIE